MSKRNRGNRQEFEASSAIFWTGFLLTSEPFSSDNRNGLLANAQTRLRVVGEAGSHRGSAEKGAWRATGLHGA